MASTVEEPDVKQTWRQPFELLLATTSSNKTPVQRVVLADKGTSKHKQARPGVFVKRYVAAQLGLTKYNVSRQRRSRVKTTGRSAALKRPCPTLL